MNGVASVAGTLARPEPSPANCVASTVPLTWRVACGSFVLMPTLPALITSGWPSVVPRKLAVGVVPALPVVVQPPLAPPPAAEMVRVLALVARVTFGPAASATTSFNPLRLLTTWPEALPAAVTALAVTPWAAAAVVAVAAAPALGA